MAKPFPDLPVRTGLAGISVAMTAQMWSHFCDRSMKTCVLQAPDLRAAGIFNLSVIPDWETIGSAWRHLLSLDHLSEEVNPQALNCMPWNGGDSPSQQTKWRARLLVWLQCILLLYPSLNYQKQGLWQSQSVIVLLVIINDNKWVVPQWWGP